MPTVVYDPEGKPVKFEFDIDARQAIQYGGYTAEPPEGQEPFKPEPLSGDELKKVDELQEKARLGAPVTPEERELLNKTPGRDPRLDESGAVHEVGSYPEGEHPGALGGAQTSPSNVPGSPPGGVGGAVANAGSPGAPVTAQDQEQSGPQSQEKADTFDPATADRSELVEYLRGQGEDIPDGRVGSTSELRQRVYEKMGVQKR